MQVELIHEEEIIMFKTAFSAFCDEPSLFVISVVLFG